MNIYNTVTKQRYNCLEKTGQIILLLIRCKQQVIKINKQFFFDYYNSFRVKMQQKIKF
jgi:hypothetical protein